MKRIFSVILSWFNEVSQKRTSITKGGGIVEQVQTLSFNYKYDVLASLIRCLKEIQDLITILFRYLSLFILIDIPVLGLVSLLYFGPKIVPSFLGTGVFLYCTSFVLLAGLHKGIGIRHSRRLIFLYITLAFFSLGALVVLVLTKLGYIHIWGLFNIVVWSFRRIRYLVLEGIGGFLVFTSFILLPGIHIGIVTRKTFARRIEKWMPRLFRGVSSMSLPERIVRIGCSLVLCSSFGYATLIEPNTLRVEEIEIMSDKVSEEVTILHLTDMHIDAIGYHEHKLFRRIQELNPDIIVQTGDLLDLYDPKEWDKNMMNELADQFRQLTPKYGTYWIVGNHDYGLAKIDWFYERAGVTLLHDDEWQIADDFGRLRLLGLSCEKSYWFRDKAFIENWLNKTEKDEFTIVMGHGPDYIIDIVELDIDLALAGHLHGGQVGIPGLQKLLLTMALQVMGSDFPAEWASGYRELENIRLNVSVGTGSHASTRMYCPPTMTLFTVKKL